MQGHGFQSVSSRDGGGFPFTRYHHQAGQEEERYLKRTLTGIAAAALVMGAMAPAAFAATGSSTTTNPYTDISGNFAQKAILDLTAKGYIHGFSDGLFKPEKYATVGQFLAYYMNTVESTTGVKPKGKAQFYTDVPPGSWDYAYVDSAYINGWINPYWTYIQPGYAFHPNYHVSRGFVSAIFVSSMEKAGVITSSDLKGMSPLAYATSIGLFEGLPANEQIGKNLGSNKVYLSRADVAMVLENILSFINGTLLPPGTTVTIVGTGTDQTDLGPNSNEQLNVVLKNADGQTVSLPNGVTPTWSIDNQAGFVSPSGMLVVTTPGTYDVTATVDGVTSAPFAVTVYGALTGFKMAAQDASVAANGCTSDTVTVTAVDANGNTVGNFDGTATVTYSGTAFAPLAVGTSNGQASDLASTSTTGTYDLTFTNGVATFNTTAGSVPGISTTYTTSYTPSGATAAITQNLTVSTVPQVATALKVVPGTVYADANAVSPVTFSVWVVDQDGEPMLTGNYPFSLSVSGPGTLVSASTGVFSGDALPGTPTPATVTVDTEQGETGAITLTATSSGITSASGTVQAVIAGAPVKLVPQVASQSSSFAEGSTLDYPMVGADSSNIPSNLSADESFTVTVTDSSGTASNILVNGVAGTNSVMTAAESSAPGTYYLPLTFADNLSGADAGSYTVTITNSAGQTWASFPLTETANTAAKFSIAANTTYVPSSNPTATFTVSLTDQYGNTVALSGAQFSLSTETGGTFVGSSSSSPNTLTVTTGANGTATATLDMLPSYSTPGTTYTVSATPVSSTVPSGFATAAATAMVTVEPYVAQSVAVNVGPGPYTAGTTVTGTVYVYGPGNIPVTYPQTLSLSTGGSNGLTNIMYTPITAAGAPVGTPTLFPSSGSVKLPSGTSGFSFTGTASTLGSTSITAQDTSVATTPSGTADIYVNAPGPLAGFAFFDASGEIASSSELTASANTPTEVFLKPVDNYGNPLVTTNVYNVDFGDGADGQFRPSGEYGANVTSEALPSGTLSVPVWYVNGTSGSYDLQALAYAPFATNSAGDAVGTVTGSVYAYSTTLFTSGVNNFAPTSLMSSGFTYAASGTMTRTFTVAPMKNMPGVYTVTLYDADSTMAVPSISYNFAAPSSS
jgi:hypothetical protein